MWFFMWFLILKGFWNGTLMDKKPPAFGTPVGHGLKAIDKGCSSVAQCMPCMHN